MTITSKRAKYLAANPKDVTAAEMQYFLSLRHEVKNLIVQVDSLKRTALQHQTLYHQSSAEAAVKGQKMAGHEGEKRVLKDQITTLGHKLDDERKLIPTSARKTLKPMDKPGKPQRGGHGAYTSEAPIAEDL